MCSCISQRPRPEVQHRIAVIAHIFLPPLPSSSSAPLACSQTSATPAANRESLFHAFHAFAVLLSFRQKYPASKRQHLSFSIIVDGHGYPSRSNQCRRLVCVKKERASTEIVARQTHPSLFYLGTSHNIPSYDKHGHGYLSLFLTIGSTPRLAAYIYVCANPDFLPGGYCLSFIHFHRRQHRSASSPTALMLANAFHLCQTSRHH